MKTARDFRFRIAHISHLRHESDVPDILCTEQFADRWAELINERDRQHGETYTPESLLAELQFCADEADPVAVLIAAMYEPNGRRKHQQKQLWPAYDDYLNLWKKVPPEIRYAQRTSRKLRSNKAAVTNTVFNRRSAVVAYLAAQTIQEK